MIDHHNVVVLAGGVGGAKLAHGIAQLVPAAKLTIIVNTGDDFWHYGLRICPDLDTVMYTLSGLVDKTNGWGVTGDTTAMLDALRRYGEEPWFRLGDQDLATHLLRTRLWHEGESLTAITRRLTTVLGIRCAILPMTDAPVATIVDTVEYGELPFQEYFVRHRWQPAVKRLCFDGIAGASVSAAVEQAINCADQVIIAPSNPWLSIDPILSVPGLRAMLLARDISRVAVTPVIGGEAVKGPTAKIMRELGYSVTPQTIVDHYGDVINAFVYDRRDADHEPMGIRHVALDTLMDTEQKRIELARQVLAWTEEGLS